jgi:hypothetical protein
LRTGYPQSDKADDQDFSKTVPITFCDVHCSTYIREILPEQEKDMTCVTDFFIISFQPDLIRRAKDGRNADKDGPRF